MAGRILVLNAGSSSIKAAVFGTDLRRVGTALAEGIGNSPALRVCGDRAAADFTDHAGALAAILDGLARHGLPLCDMGAAAHRVVHGGRDLIAPARVTRDLRERIAALAPLAPLHNPHNLAAIEHIVRIAPDLPQFASFDTAFHATRPEVDTRYALPPQVEAETGIRRYGFHGLSYAALVDALPRLSGAPLPRRLLALHLGNGASLCAIRDGRSVATTMGYSPLEGLTMGTRAGSIDGNAVLRLVEVHGLDRTRAILNAESGLRGLSGGTADMRGLLADPGPQARFAVDHFVHAALRGAGAMIAAMEGIDALAFTGGIGENAAPIRARILAGLAWAGVQTNDDANAAGATRLHADGSCVTAWIVPAAEERQIASEALNLWQGA